VLSPLCFDSAKMQLMSSLSEIIFSFFFASSKSSFLHQIMFFFFQFLYINSSL
jgi:hypothetical protein